MAKKKIFHKRTVIFLLLALVIWRAWPLIPIFTGLNIRVSNEENLIDELLPPSTQPTKISGGLSHPHFEKNTLIKEILIGQRMISHGHAFHPRKVQILPEHLKITSILSERSSYGKWGGEKGCGGFHGDFLINWKDKHKTSQAILCNGCSEVILYSEGKAVRCNLTKNPKLMISSLYSRIKGTPSHSARESFQRLLLSIEFLDNPDAVTEDPNVVVENLRIKEHLKLIKRIKSHTPNSTDQQPEIAKLFNLQILACFKTLSQKDWRAESLINLLVDPEINWTPSELLALQKVIVNHGRRAVCRLETVAAEHDSAQHCLDQIKAKKLYP